MPKTALITGGARGIGYGIATCLAKEDVNIVIMDLHPPEAVQENLDRLEELGVQVLYCVGDVTNAADRSAAIGAIVERFGSLDVLVNNAGVAPKVRADILEATEESFERVLRINLQGPYFMTQAAANLMIAQKRQDSSRPACIVNVSSISAFVASPSRGDYCISKAGVTMATKLWAARLGEFDIPVYEVQPGVIYTDMTAVVKEKYDKLIGEGLCLQARWGTPEDVGKVVAALARGDLAYSTGQSILVDGGMTVNRL